NADARVFDAETQRIPVFHAGNQIDLAAVGCVLDGVAQQVAHHQFHQFPVGTHPFGPVSLVEVDGDVALFERVGVALYHPLHNVAHIGRTNREIDPVGDD